MKKIGMALLILIIVVFNFIIGANEKGLRVLPIGILMTLILVYLLVKKIKKPDKSMFFKSKIDYLVLIFMLTTMLPLVFGTYCSYSDTVEFIMKYFFIYSVYILARNTITEKKDINQVITATLICSIIPQILGLDYVNTKYLEGFVDSLNLTYVDFPSFCATFGYSNTVAIYMTLCIFLAIYKIKNSDNKIVKIITLIYILFISYIMWITESKSVIALTLIALALYLLIENRKKIHENLKKVLIVFALIMLVGIPLLLCAVNTSKPFIIKEQYFVKRIKYNFEPNVKYKLELDLEAFIDEVQIKDSAFELQIIQANKYFFESKIAKMRFGNTNGKVVIEFTPEEGYSYINIRILNDFYGKINIKKCYINGEEYILKYKYVPIQLGQIFSHYVLNQKSLREREYIYSDCIKIAKESPIIGQGGNTWRVVSPTVEEYKTRIKETHSYFFELLISYGIIGVVAFLVVVISLFVKLFKQMKNDKDVRKEKILITIGLFLVLIHSIAFDFNMSFMLIQLIVYIYMAVLLYDEQNHEKAPKIVDYALLACLVLVLSVYIRADVAKYFVDDINIKQGVLGYSKEYSYKKLLEEAKKYDNYISILKDARQFIKREPYCNQTRVYKIYLEQICNNAEKLSDEELLEYTDFIIQKLKTTKFETPLFIETILTRTEVIKKAINSLKEYENKLEDKQERKEIINNAIKGLEEVLENEYEKNIHNIEANYRTGYSEDNTQMIKQQYLNILEKANQ